MTDIHAQLAQMAKMLTALDGWLDKAVQHAEAKNSATISELTLRDL
jgi:hypothetical protein